MGLKKDLQIQSLKILGSQINSQDARWPEVSIFSDAYGHVEVLRAFEMWADSRRGTRIQYVLSEFCRALPDLMEEIRTIGGQDPEFPAKLDDLCAELYLLNNLQAFTGKERDTLALLLKTYTVEELKSSYAEYTTTLDDFELKRAARTFAQGGATSVILANRKQKALLKSQEELLKNTQNKMLAEHAAIRQDDESAASFELPEA